MARRPRFDAPGRIHHVYGRGIARRTVFETRRDVRYFLALLACEVRAGRIQVLSYCILTTHFHLVVRSTNGDLARVMQRVLNLYVRYFNRTRRRDGPLFRSRYGSRPVCSVRYLRALIHYTDRNPSGARLVTAASQYPYGSASHYASGRIPRWLRTEEISSLLGRPSPEDFPAHYRRMFDRPLDPAVRRVVDARLTRAPSDRDELDDLIEATTDRVRDWMRRKAKLADNTVPGESYADSRTIRDRVASRLRDDPDWGCKPVRRTQPAGPIVLAGLLRDLGGLTFSEIARLVRSDESSVRRRVRDHRLSLLSDPVYAGRTAEIADSCLRWAKA